MMALFAAAELDELKNRIDIVEIVSAHLRLRKAGRNFTGLCPFHQEKTPSFSVNRERGFFYCFGCGAGGTAFNFVMRVEGLSFPESVRTLAKRYGVTVRAEVRDRLPHGERETMIHAAEIAQKFFAHVLWNTPEGASAREYLERRKISGETAHHFALGYAPARRAALAAALRKRSLLVAGLRIGVVRGTAEDPHDMFRARLTFPIRDAQGRAIAFGGRLLGDGTPKYLNSPESPLYTKARTLYGLFEARAAINKTDRAIVVEGYVDAITLSQAGFEEVVASLGTSLTVEQLRLLGRRTQNVLACFDGDSAGQRASIRALEVFVAAGLLGRGIFIPSGLDPDRLIRERGRGELQKLIDSAQLLIDYFLETQAQVAKGSLSGQARAAERVSEVLRRISNPFEFDLATRKASELLGVREDLLRRESRRSGPQPRDSSVNSASSAPSGAQRGASSEAELGLLAAAIAYPELRPEIGVIEITFEDEKIGELVARICALETENGAQVAALVERLPEVTRSQLGAVMVGPLMDGADKARELLKAYAEAMRHRVQARAIEALTRAAAGGSEVEAIERAQRVIEIRRKARKVH